MINFRNIKHIFFIVAICLTILFSSYIYVFKDFIAPINYFFTYQTGNNNWQDYIHEHNLEPGKNIVIVEIDEKTINTLGGKSEYSMLTIEKDKYKELVTRLNKLSVKAIGFDIVFQNPDIYETDFAETMKNAGNVTIATLQPNAKNHQNGNVTIDNCSGNPDNLEDLICPDTPRAVYKDIRWGHIEAMSDIHKGIEKKQIGYDMSKFPMQTTIKFGRENINLRPWDAFVYTLPVAMIWDENSETVKNFKKNFLPNKNAVDGFFVMQPYFSEKNTNKQEKPYKSISMLDILEQDEVMLQKNYGELLKDAYVFVGEEGSILHDTFISPVTNSKLAGVYSHAFLLDGILQNKLLHKLDQNITYFLSIIITIIFVIIYFYLPKYFAPVLAFFSFFFTIFIARYSYDAWRTVFDIFPFLLASALITFPVTYSYKFFVVDKDKRQILHAFSRYLSPSVVNMIDANKINATLGGEKKELSILFSDIAGFTTISEKLSIKDLFALMTKYLSTMTNILINEKGTLDKYIGDAVMGFFGAPVDDPFHAVNACNTALKMRAALGGFNEMLISEWKETINFRVGIATGEVMVGNIGSEQQFNYTVLGDTVNLASRLEATGKEYGVSIIISAGTRLAIWNQFLLRELDYIAVKWKNEGVRIYELLGHTGDTIDMTAYSVYESALRLYREGKYLDAGRIFEKNAEIDPPSHVMMMRCVALIKWEMSLENGVYKMTHK